MLGKELRQSRLAKSAATYQLENEKSRDPVMNHAVVRLLQVESALEALDTEVARMSIRAYRQDERRQAADRRKQRRARRRLSK